MAKYIIPSEKSSSSIFSPFKIKNLLLNNRVVRSATLEGMSNPDGSPTEELNKLYCGLITGECGLIITGASYISNDSQTLPFQNGIHKDFLIKKWKKVTDEVHKLGGKIVMQLTHQALGSRPLLGELVAPSPVYYRSKRGLIVPRELKNGEICQIIKQFINAAVRVQKAGFDGVQLQLAHGYLLSQFISPLTNKRSDDWGGNTEKRSKIILEILTGIRKRIGESYPILAKINSSDYVRGGLDERESSKIINILSKGGICAFELSGDLYGGLRKSHSSGVLDEDDQCFYEKEAMLIRKENPDLIIGLCGGIRSAKKIEKLLKDGFDFASLCRPFVKEPNFVKKIREDYHSKAECISCSQCFQSISSGSTLNCQNKINKLDIHA